ncbi:MAG: hypothetical protein ACREL1_04300 [bacterium]
MKKILVLFFFLAFLLSAVFLNVACQKSASSPTIAEVAAGGVIDFPTATPGS